MSENHEGYACDRLGMVMPWRCGHCTCWPAPIRESRKTASMDALLDGSNAHELCSACGGAGRVYEGEQCNFCEGTGTDRESRTVAANQGSAETLPDLIADYGTACHYRAIGLVAHGKEEALASVEQAVATLTAELAEAQEQRDSLRDECERLRTWAESLENDWMIREQCALINGGMKVEQACIHAETRLKMAKVAALSASGRDADGDGRGK